MPNLYFVRHAENRANVERLMSWRAIDYPLTELGERQADAVADWFRGKPVEAVYTSPLMRARQTAERIADAVAAPLHEAEDLHELAVGELDGLGDPDSWAIHDAIVHRWRQGEWAARFPGGESYREAYDRLAAVVQDVVARHAEGDVAIVGHGGLFSTVLPRLCPLAGHDGISPLRLRNTAITIVRHDAGTLSCDSWGAIDHLTAELTLSS